MQATCRRKKGDDGVRKQGIVSGKRKVFEDILRVQVGGNKVVYKFTISTGLLKKVSGELNEKDGLKVAAMQLHRCQLPLKPREEVKETKGYKGRSTVAPKCVAVFFEKVYDGMRFIR